MKISPSKGHGFTIIELLVVIAIMSILTAIIMTNISGSRAKARDAKRISDLGHIQLALELFFDRCKQYPATLSTSASCSTNSGTVTLGDYISVIPTPPAGISGQAAYNYRYYTLGTTRVNYILNTPLETYNEAMKDSLTSSQAGITGWGGASFTCGTVGGSNNYCIGPK